MTDNPQDCSRIHSSAGFGLLDAVVGAALLAVALMASAQLVLDTSNMRYALEVQRVAWDAMDRQVKQIESTPFDEILASHQGRGFGVAEAGGLTLTAPGGDADGQPGAVSIEVPDPPNDPGELLEVVVTIQWSGRNGQQSISQRRRVSRIGGAQ